MEQRQLIEKAQIIRGIFLSEDWTRVQDPTYFSNHRIFLASLTAEIGLLLPELERNIAVFKKGRDDLQLSLIGEGTIKEAELKAKSEFATRIIEAEKDHSEVLFLYNGCKELLNALASKINTLSNEARNLT